MWLTVLVMVSSYAGCHQSPPNIFADLQDPPVVVVIPDSGGSGCGPNPLDDTSFFPKSIFMPLENESYDVFSLLFRLGTVMNDVGSPRVPSNEGHKEPITNPVNTGTQECKSERMSTDQDNKFTQDFQYSVSSRQYFARVCFAATIMPTIFLFSSLLPSFYTIGFHGVCHWKLLNTVMSWGVLSGVCFIFMCNVGMMHFSSVLSTHLSAHCMLSVCRGIHTLDGGGAIMVLPFLGITSMSLGIALLCWGVTVSTPHFVRTETTQFYLYHLASIVVVDVVRVPMWMLSSIVGAQGNTVFCHSFWDI